MDNKNVIIIAEAGVNHNGDIGIAKELIDAAAEAGADFVKFQTFKADTIVSKAALKADYQDQNIKDGDRSQYNMLKKLELNEGAHEELIRHCALRNIKFFSTAFDVEGLKYLNSLGFERFKIPSGEITNYPYLKYIASLNKPVILSTGMSTMGEIEDALQVLTSSRLNINDISVLHCNTEYPTPMEDVNLLAMKSIANELNVKVGYSDHTLGIEVPIAAVALGASIIEKHFTIDRNLPGPDHSASLEPNELKAMISAIRNIEKAISGSGKKEPSKSELKNKSVARKSIFTKTVINKGEPFTSDNIIPLRPGDGISVMEWETVLSKKASKDLEPFQKLKKEDLD